MKAVIGAGEAHRFMVRRFTGTSFIRLAGRFGSPLPQLIWKSIEQTAHFGVLVFISTHFRLNPDRPKTSGETPGRDKSGGRWLNAFQSAHAGQTGSVSLAARAGIMNTG